MHTEVCDRLGMEFPIFAFSHCRDVVAAVTNAGGFGVLGATAHSPRTLEIDLAWIDEQVKGKPYGVDLLLPAKYDKTAAQPRRAEPAPAGPGGTGPGTSESGARFPAGHQAFLADLLARYGVPELPGHLTATSGSLSVSPQAAEHLLDVAFSHPIRLVASALGPPPAELVSRAHDRDVIVAALVGTAEHARRQQAAGVDLIVAQGTEAGGHTGTISTMVLVPEVVRAVAPTPVLAAGGIVTGAQMAAAMALLGLAHHRGSGNRPVGQAEDARRLGGRHGPVPVADRQARPDAAQRVDRRMGRRPGPGRAADAAADHAHRPGPAAHQPQRGC
jgi:NAD(P)H-dependent flavin oxidoreductase YrpB (nitropropane dioxygenase family)